MVRKIRRITTEGIGLINKSMEEAYNNTEKNLRIMKKNEMLLQILVLLIENDNTSSSKTGLEKREENRDKAIKILLDGLKMTYQDAKDLWLEKI